MFNCSECKKTIGPRVGSIPVVTGTRPTEYHNEFYIEDEWGNREKKEVDSRGEEITGERLVCPDCAKVQPAISSIERRGFGFQEKQADPFKRKLVEFAIESTVRRLDHRGKRAKRDVEVAVPLLKQFMDENKGLV